MKTKTITRVLWENIKNVRVVNSTGYLSKKNFAKCAKRNLARQAK